MLQKTALSSRDCRTAYFEVYLKPLSLCVCLTNNCVCCAGVCSVHTPIWLSGDPAYSGALPAWADSTDTGGNTSTHRAAGPGNLWSSLLLCWSRILSFPLIKTLFSPPLSHIGSVWELRNSARVGARPRGGQEQDCIWNPWKCFGAQPA